MAAWVYFHCCVLPGNTSGLDMLRDQFEKSYKSGLFEHAAKVHVVMLGSVDKTTVQNIPHFPDVEKTTLHFVENVEEREMATLSIIHAHCKNLTLAESANVKVLYVHTKGITRHRNLCVQDWRHMMEYFCITQWRNCVAALDVEGVSAVGCNLLPWPLSHFSGNFWWATAKHIQALASPDEWSKQVQPLKDKFFRNDFLVLRDECYVLQNSGGATAKTLYTAPFLSEHINGSGSEHYMQRLPEETYASASSFRDIFFSSNRELSSDKWHHYLDVYEHHFLRFKSSVPVILEIGVQNGGSIETWYKYFNGRCKIIGVDIQFNQSLAKKFPEVLLLTGDQGDVEFWKVVLPKLPEIDIVVDDGGHTMQQQIVTFEALYPKVKANGGVYLCEDVHTSYWPSYGGGLRHAHSFLEYSKRKIDELNAHHWKGDAPVEEFTRTTNSMHFYDSIVVFEKTERAKPVRSLSAGERPLV